MQYTCGLFGAKSPICENQLLRSNKRIQLSFCSTNHRNCFSKSNIRSPARRTMKMNDLFHKRNEIYNNIHLLFDPNVQLTFFVYNISSLGPSLHSVNRQRALHKMNTRFQFGTHNIEKTTVSYLSKLLELWLSFKMSLGLSGKTF